MIQMKATPKKTQWSALLALVLILGGSVGQAQVGITLAVNGYYGNNLSASGANLADGTSVKLGFFHTGTAFLPTTDVLNSWLGLSGTMASKLSSFDDNFYTLASASITSANGNGAEWQILYSPDPDVQPNPAFQSLFNINPAVSTPALSSINLVGYKPFIWVETVDRSEFGLFESKLAFPTGAFPDNDLSIDVINTGATALVGTLLADDTGLQTIPEPTSASLALLGFGLLSLLRRRVSDLKS
jgi:hypothetical protein